MAASFRESGELVSIIVPVHNAESFIKEIGRAHV